MRSSGMLQGDRRTGRFLYHRRSGYDRYGYVACGTWSGAGVFNVEEFDPDPYMDALNKYGLPWQVDENPVLVD